ncbi:long-chain acyl-CoA synthetase [Paragonimus westermani]|uniref:long-chain-fatty-acid--CoA ligase n=1 Tax=Paragonimus westermani TaxID=34504 RepID=A0A5J4NZ49_9TREM|nr:long-chain acyl-CoA synthetase [Paragonimus westermani]
MCQLISSSFTTNLPSYPSLAINVWLTSQLSNWSGDPTGTLSVAATFLATYALYRLYIHWFHTQYLQPSQFLDKQSVVTDPKTGVRVSPLASTFPRDDQLTTYYDLFLRGMAIARRKPCLGRRRDFDQPIDWWTYDEVDSRIRAVGSALTHLCGTDDQQETMIGIYGKNSPEWVVTLFACSAYSLVALPLYETLGSEAMEHVCRQGTWATEYETGEGELNWLLCSLGQASSMLAFIICNAMVILIPYNSCSKHFYVEICLRDTYDRSSLGPECLY